MLFVVADFTSQKRLEDDLISVISQAWHIGSHVPWSLNQSELWNCNINNDPDLDYISKKEKLSSSSNASLLLK